MHTHIKPCLVENVYELWADYGLESYDIALGSSLLARGSTYL